MPTEQRILGQWSVAYLPPGGGQIPGRLCVTDRQVLFEADVEAGRLQPRTRATLDGRSLAYALDLDCGQVAYDGRCLRLTIGKAAIEDVRPARAGLGQGVRLTLKDNGSVHLFAVGLRPVRRLLRALCSCPPEGAQ